MLLNIMVYTGLIELVMLTFLGNVPDVLRQLMSLGMMYDEDSFTVMYYLKIFITTTKYTTEKCSNIKIMLLFRKVNMDLERKTQLTKAYDRKQNWSSQAR